MINKILYLISLLTSKLNLDWLNRITTSLDYCRFEFYLKKSKTSSVLNDIESQALFDLDKYGICIIKDFWSVKKCQMACAEVDRVINSHPEYVNQNAKADQRVYGANNASELISEFAKDGLIENLANAYNRESTSTAFTLAAKMPASDGNQGSGEGWHRDAFLRQFKAILYLSDVGLDNGPFQIILDSHRRANVLRDMKAGALKYMQYRITNEQIDSILQAAPDRLMTYTASAGTLILVDTSMIHRGMPIKAGTRYALTNYCFLTNRIDQSMYEKFSVIPAL